ncbi:MAG: alpha/beta hydrolase [Gammaproteobacteria bacterium]
MSANDVAHMIVAAPNEQHSGSNDVMLEKVAGTLYVKRFEVPVGPPSAKLAAAVIAPRNYGFSASAKWKKNPRSLTLKWRIHNNVESASGSKSGQARSLTGAKADQYLQNMLRKAIPKLPICRATGTVILLPGWGEPKETLLGYALAFASHGYRVVLVDLRGQGKSSGKYVTYGLIEHRDIAQLISALYARKLVVGKLALVGVSEGATIALDTAAADSRVDAVVAIAPFVNLRTAIRGVANVFMPNMSKAVSKQKLTHALAIADARVGMNLAEANPISRVGNIRAPVLYVAGGKDHIAPAADVRKLAAKTPHARFVELPRYPHPALYFGVSKVAPPALAALAQALGPSTDPSCLQTPPPKDASYDFKFAFKLSKR